MTEKKLFRSERDSIGIKDVPVDALYGVQTLRAAENFQITHTLVHPEMVKSMAAVKKACAIVNKRVGTIKPEVADAIIEASEEVMAGKYLEEFITDAIQGGAGTSMNMNANEVIANIAAVKLGGKPGDYNLVHPNNDVNFGQSTNDVIPTAGKLTALVLMKKLEKELGDLEKAFLAKSEEFDGIIKMGRTQLQDAVPIRLGQEFHAYAEVTKRGLERIRKSEAELLSIPLGGTAIGTGINADAEFYNTVCDEFAKVTGFDFKQAEDTIDATQNIDGYAAVSSAIKNCALGLSKVGNDLRLLSSGPRTGIGEINLPAMQNGSSIMPGKVNPVIPEVLTQAAFLCAGNDVTIGMAVEAGQMELNAFEPVTFYCLFGSIDALTGAVNTFIHNCVEGITANEQRCYDLLHSSVGTITALNPYIGYQAAADTAKEALKTGKPVRELILEKGLLSEEELEKVLDPFAMTKPGIPGK